MILNYFKFLNENVSIDEYSDLLKDVHTKNKKLKSDIKKNNSKLSQFQKPFYKEIAERLVSIVGKLKRTTLKNDAEYQVKIPIPIRLTGDKYKNVYIYLRVYDEFYEIDLMNDNSGDNLLLYCEWDLETNKISVDCDDEDFMILYKYIMSPDLTMYIEQNKMGLL